MTTLPSIACNSKPSIQTWTFEGAYNESDEAGSRSDFVQAYNRDQALALAGLEVMIDNEWTVDRLGECTSFAEFYEEEIDIHHESTDRFGATCPNCSSHSGVPTSDSEAEAAADAPENYVPMECQECHFKWLPIGFVEQSGIPSSDDIDRELAAAWADYTGKDDEEDEAAEDGRTAEADYLILYGASNDTMIFTATSRDDAIEQFVRLEHYHPDPEENRAAIKEVCMILPTNPDGQPSLTQLNGRPIILWQSKPQDYLQIGVEGMLISIKHDDEGVVVDISEEPGADPVSSTFALFPS